MAKTALIIANTEYTDPGLAQLTAPGKDASDFARVIQDKSIGAFDHVDILLNQSSYTVGEAIDGFFDEKKPDDLLLLYFSGHGIRDENGLLYLAVKNTNRFRLRSTAIKSDFIREAMDQSRSRRQVLVLDCCNSGAFAQGTKAATGVSIGTASAFEGTGYGRVVLTASDSTQFAWEGDGVIGDTRNSLFTHFLVKGLEGEADNDGDGRITVDELYDYAYDQILKVTPKQTPGKWSYKQQGEIVLRESTRVEDIKAVPLPDELLSAIENPFSSVREGAARQLRELLGGRNIGLARSAREALTKMADEDDSIRVRQAAKLALEPAEGAVPAAVQAVEEPISKAEVQPASPAAEKAPAAGKVIEDVQLLSTQTAREVTALPVPRAARIAVFKAPEELFSRARAAMQRKPGKPAAASVPARIESKPLAPRASWYGVLWIALAFAIGFSGTWQIAYNLGSSAEPALIGAICGLVLGLVTSMALRLAHVFSGWKTIFWISLGFTVDFAIAGALGGASGDTSVILTLLVVGTAFGGIITALVLWREHILPGWQGILLVTLGFVIGVAIVWEIVDLASGSVLFAHHTIATAVIGAIIGAAGGSVLIWQIRSRKTF